VKLIWVTDSHFQLDVPAFRRPFEQYLVEVAAERPDAVLLGGDLCTRTSLGRFLKAFRDIVRVPTYFILGNHEHLGALIGDVRTQIEDLVVNRKQGLVWLSHASEPAWLADGVALIGTGSWGDARAGNLSAHNLRRRGHQLLYDQVEDIRLLWNSCSSDTVCIARGLQAFLMARGEEAAAHIDRLGRIAARNAKLVIILLHAPPVEATLRRGKVDPLGLPFFGAKTVGDALRGLAENYSDVQFNVLAGHTHHETDVQIHPNLRVFVHDPVGNGVQTRWGVLEVDSRGLIYQKSEMKNGIKG